MAVVNGTTGPGRRRYSLAHDLIDSRERDVLVENNLIKGGLFEFGERFTVELEPPSVPQQYAGAVVAAYRRKRLTSERAVELLHGTLAESELPEPARTAGPVPGG